MRQENNLTDRRRLVPEAKLRLMMSSLLRQESLFLLAKDKLQSFHFEERGLRVLAVVWTSVLDFSEEFKRLPCEDELVADIESRLEDDPDALTLDDIEDLNRFTEFTFRVAEDFNRDVALATLQQLLTESLQYSMHSQAAGDTLVHLPELLQLAANEACKIRSIQAGPVQQPFPEDIDEVKPLVKVSTGVSFIDEYMGGGAAEGEVYGFCGPYGSCKTTLAVQLAVESCVRASMQHIEAGGILTKGCPLTYLVAWEEEITSLQHRALAYYARIRRESLEAGDYKTKLSRRGNLKPYEKVLFRSAIDAGVDQDGEYERMQSAMKFLNHTLRFVDFTGAVEEYQDMSSQMEEGVAQVIAHDQEMLERPGVSSIFLDYAGAAAERCCSENGWDPSKRLRHMIGKMPMRAKNKLAIPFHTHVWIMHQLGTEANSRAAGIAPKATDSSEARNFFENVNFGFMVGVPTIDGLTVLTNKKQRRAARQSDRVLLIDGALATVRDVHNKFVISDGKIVDADSVSRVVDDESTGGADGIGGLFGSFGGDIGV